MRIVELIPRSYKDDINFALEKLISEKLYQKKDKLIDKVYKVYDLQYMKAHEKVFLSSSNLDIRSTIIINHNKKLNG